MNLRRLVKQSINSIGIDIGRFSPPDPVEKRAFDILRMLRNSTQPCELRDSTAGDPRYDFLRFCAANWADSPAQLFQDLLALYLSGSKRGGFFVEFGAANGLVDSNSLLLERDYGWKGILSEPARGVQSDLRRNRNCQIDSRCVWSSSGAPLRFSEAQDTEFSTIESYSQNDLHTATRGGSVSYDVETVSLNDLLKEHNAPNEIDYISIDTEGSELEILGAFDFSDYKINLITVEHNWSPIREPINKLLTAKGFAPLFPEFSRWDDWYALKRPTE